MGERLGQHFLTSRGAIDAMLKAADVKAGDTVLEVGPGKGVLTEALLATGAHVIAVEKDAALCASLQFRVSSFEKNKLEVICEDILEFDTTNKLKAISYKLISNIPYYITGQFLRKFLETNHQPTSMTLMVQKEVAQRIVAKDGRESILSISVKAFGTPHYVQTVKAGSFNPPPKVDSAIIHIDNIKKLDERSSTSLMNMVKRGFASKRKLLKNNLETKPEILTACGIPEKARAEQLSVENWRCLVNSQ